MNVLKWMAGGLVGASIGAAVWVAIGYFANYEVGWIAWGIGLLAGIGVRMAAGESDGPAPGVVAVGVAVLAIVVAKYLVISLSVDAAINAAVEEFSTDGTELTAQDGINFLAGEIATEMEEQGEQVQWPEDEAVYENEDYGDNYPAEIWEQAVAKWEALTPQEQAAKLDAQKAQSVEFMNQFQEQVRQTATEEGFKESFSPFDLLWFALAAFTAFRVGSGAQDEREATA